MRQLVADRRHLIDITHSDISINRQCELLQVSKGALYYQPRPIDPYTLLLMDLIDKQHTITPFYGSRRLVAWLKQEGHPVNRKRVQGLMKKMRIEAIYPKPKLTRRNEAHKVYPYLLRGVNIARINHVWSTDITYIRIGNGFVYLTAVIDWFSRYVLSWRLSNTLENTFCVEVLEEALSIAEPEIFNTDQGCQYTATNFLKVLTDHKIKVSMDSKGRALDNIFVERLWRTVKYEEVYLKSYQSMKDAQSSLKTYLNFYNKKRLHQALEYKTPESIYCMANEMK
ncbi:transposase (IS150 family protein) [Desulforapulum autotrophicum HRM2]|uniref:IstA1 n=1 Tax=Desulforapulum autotrophicum (strain ATCC 43914 / DSM 3382 / VKM B-1955 / HRM2) TaxID=177437 RepID=C0Q950_DESAH|nr:IS3 family transposase [Desulforapulum autotrophicum]ACN15113.1 IstA1 [Desulforapulum autotrophicum HRM2]ACN16555.1 transposase (IS150 family protein) [Desulforapulum autotrophicum HRM2]